MSFDFIIRIIGMLVMGGVGGYWGYDFAANSIPDQIVGYSLGFALLGALSGLLFTPYVTTAGTGYAFPAWKDVSRRPVCGIAGLDRGPADSGTAGFSAVAPAQTFGRDITIPGSSDFSYLGISLFEMRQGDNMGLLSALNGRSEGGSSSAWTNLNSETSCWIPASSLTGVWQTSQRLDFYPARFLFPALY
ncbi:hypothetical protein [Candidatus Villigracilis saccharophilus]|uniref:hypothetical protein n=1 Tax=Candidatus Villigracilis saccharophilus TaxID=3140684 RepID=UPI003134B3B5|nr:hypothetical protein [Anaerolineales bacterium]